MDNKETLIKSLLAQQVKTPRGGIIQNELGKHVRPSVNLFPINSILDKSLEEDAGQYKNVEIWPEKKETDANQQFFPLTLVNAEESTAYTFPFEPQVTITGKNNIIKRNVAKGKNIGSVKERWSRDDYSIEITCFLMGEDIKLFPTKEFQELYKHLKVGDTLGVHYEPFNLLDIHYIVIEDFSVPFTKGENMQAFTINAVSDDCYDLLINTNKSFGSV